MSTHARRASAALPHALAAVALLVVLAPAALAPSAHAAAVPTPPIAVGTPPTAVITVPSPAYAGVPLTLSGAASTASGPGGIAQWAWDLTGGGSFAVVSQSTAWTTRAFGAGPHTVRLQVRDTAGLVGTATARFTVRAAPAAAAPPDAVPAVRSSASGTTVDVAWGAATGAPLAYRVANTADLGSDPVYVPAGRPLRASFPDLVPGSYPIRVSAVNAAGSGPVADTTAVVAGRAPVTGTTGAATTAPTAPTATASARPAPSRPPATATSGGGSRGSGRTVGLLLVAAGVVVLALAAGLALAGLRRRPS